MNKFIRSLEAFIFWSRWLQAPLYVGLIFAQGLFVYKFGVELVHLVTRTDSLARSTFDLFGIVKRIVDAKAQFRSLAEPWADTGTSTGRLMIAVLGGLADVERDLIRTRTAEGRSRAQKRGQHMGRPVEIDGSDARRALRLPNSREATAWERAPFQG